jgi:hypothetical protein
MSVCERRIMWRWSASRRTVARLPRTERSEGRGVFVVVLWHRDILFGYKIIALARNVTPVGGAGLDSGRTVALAIQRFSLVTQFSRHGEVIAYTDSLAQGCYYKFGSISGGQLFNNNLIYLLFRLC